jgi:hypothetical protein
MPPSAAAVLPGADHVPPGRGFLGRLSRAVGRDLHFFLCRYKLLRFAASLLTRHDLGDSCMSSPHVRSFDHARVGAARRIATALPRASGPLRGRKNCETKPISRGISMLGPAKRSQFSEERSRSRSERNRVRSTPPPGAAGRGCGRSGTARGRRRRQAPSRRC